jgi:hypothetical protein
MCAIVNEFCLEYYLPKFGDTSIPGESTKTTSSRNNGHLSVGQKTLIKELSPSESAEERRECAN